MMTTILEVFDHAASVAVSPCRCYEVRCEDCSETPWATGALRKRGLTAEEARAFLVEHQAHRSGYRREIEEGAGK